MSEIHRQHKEEQDEARFQEATDRFHATMERLDAEHVAWCKRQRRWQTTINLVLLGFVILCFGMILIGIVRGFFFH